MIATVTLPAVQPAPHLRPFAFRSVALTHPGCVRALNEDSCLDRPDIGLWAVADGMGGHAQGDVASQTVIRHLNSVANFTTAFHFRHAARSALMEANGELQKRSDEDLLDVIGSTVVAFMVHQGHYACMWAGDSRAYRYRGGALQRLTSDHNLFQKLAAEGSISDDVARGHAGLKVVTRAVGADPKLELDGVHGSVALGDRFLLCSDGLEVLAESEIEALLGVSDISSAARQLMNSALGCAASDNVSMVLIEVQSS